jgi:hypothetical protein
MTDSFLKKLIVSVIALLGFMVWSYSSRVKAPEECADNCMTDFSAKRR